MTTTTPRIILAALATLALLAPAASAQPVRAQAPRHQDPFAPISVQQWPFTPAQLEPIATPVQVTSDDDRPPLVYIIPGVLLLAMLAAGLVYARTPRPVASER